MSLLDLVNENDANQLKHFPTSGINKNSPKFKPLVSAKEARNLSFQSKKQKQKFVQKINEKYKPRNDVYLSEIIFNKEDDDEEEEGISNLANLTNDQKELREIQFLYETMGKKTGVDEYQPDDNKTKLFTWKFGDNYEEEEMGEEDVQSVEIDYPGADDFDPNDLDTY